MRQWRRWTRRWTIMTTMMILCVVATTMLLIKKQSPTNKKGKGMWMAICWWHNVRQRWQHESERIIGGCAGEWVAEE